MSVDSPHWSIREGFGGHTLHVIQRASGKTVIVSRSAFPSAEEVAAMTEARFNRLCREAFHGA